jgi:hypothetical protein
VTAWHVSPEMQILDNSKYPHRDKRQLAGACYDLHAPVKDATNPPGEWNQARLVVNEAQVEHWLNGMKLLEYELGSKDWNDLVAASKFKDKPNFAAKVTSDYKATRTGVSSATSRFACCRLKGAGKPGNGWQRIPRCSSLGSH